MSNEATNKKDKYKCEQCLFQTEYEANLQRHIEKQNKSEMILPKSMMKMTRVNEIGKVE